MIRASGNLKRPGRPNIPRPVSRAPHLLPNWEQGPRKGRVQSDLRSPLSFYDFIELRRLNEFLAAWNHPKSLIILFNPLTFILISGKHFFIKSRWGWTCLIWRSREELITKYFPLTETDFEIELIRWTIIAIYWHCWHLNKLKRLFDRTINFVVIIIFCSQQQKYF